MSVTHPESTSWQGPLHPREIATHEHDLGAAIAASSIRQALKAPECPVLDQRRLITLDDQGRCSLLFNVIVTAAVRDLRSSPAAELQPHQVSVVARLVVQREVLEAATYDTADLDELVVE